MSHDSSRLLSAGLTLALLLTGACAKPDRCALDRLDPDQEAQLATLLELARFVRVDADARTIIFEGVNMHLVSGSGATDDDGLLRCLGNLSIGYGGFATFSQSTCGSHNFVIGDGHVVESHGGVAIGEDHHLAAPDALAIGGVGHVITGTSDVAVGSKELQSLGSDAWAADGRRDRVEGDVTSVLGSDENCEVMGPLSSVDCRRSSARTGEATSVSGGEGVGAVGLASTMAGGSGRLAEGAQSLVTGGCDPISDDAGALAVGGNNSRASCALAGVTGCTNREKTKMGNTTPCGVLR